MGGKSRAHCRIEYASDCFGRGKPLRRVATLMKVRLKAVALSSAICKERYDLLIRRIDVGTCTPAGKAPSPRRSSMLPLGLFLIN